jgi:CYTH domain-containing protein
MPNEPKYARIEWERRFLLAKFPDGAQIVAVRRIADRYIEGTRLRLRRQQSADGSVVFKLTQKIPETNGKGQQGLITTFYLSAEEFAALESLPARMLAKTRYSVPPFGIDVFSGPLDGLILAEMEFASASEAEAPLSLPPYVHHEVSHDLRFTGGALVETSREQLRSALADYQIYLT